MTLAEDLANVWNEAEARRGRRWAYPELDASRTALVVLGLTRGLLQQSPRAQGALARLEALAETLRLVGGKVLWTHPDDRPAPPGLALVQGAGRLTAAQEAIAPEAPRRAGDLTLRIRPPSLFYPGASHAPHLLRGWGVSTVIFAGGLTHLEVESSVRDAVCAGFQCVVAGDCCLDRTPEAHLGSLRTLHRSFADVRPAQDLVGLLRRNVGLSAFDVDEAMEEAVMAVVASAAGMEPMEAERRPEARRASPALAPLPAALAAFPPPEPAPAPAAPEEEDEDFDDGPSMEAVLESIRQAEAKRLAGQAGAMDESAPTPYIPFGAAPGARSEAYSEGVFASETDRAKP